jgi:RNA-directed DNA polymerase
MNVGELQRKLSSWAEQDKEHRFFDLYHLLYDKDWLRLAHDYVKQNAGSKTAGCDGIKMSAFDESLEGNLQKLGEDLKSETFEPLPVRRVMIPKANGKIRPLGIPSVCDRIVQEALRMILEPIYEVDFNQHSFGFRPNRCTMDAIRAITWYTSESKRFFWVVEGDIASYFDTICHRKLIKLIRRRIKDERLIRLIWKFLRAGVMEGKLFKDSERGTPQGGIISPLLANIYLNELDRYVLRHTGFSQYEKTKRRKQGMGNVVYVRYADDFVVLTNGHKAQAEEIKEELYQFLKEELRLNLSKEKTKVTHLNDGFRFLGFELRRCLGGKGKMTTKILIPRQAKDRFRATIAAATARETFKDSLNAKILALNQVIGGWCRYYQYTSKASSEFGGLGHFVFWRTAHWLGGKYKLAMPEVMKRYYLRGGKNTFATGQGYRLILPSEFSSATYKKRFLKPNPYTTKEGVKREELPNDKNWTGYEARLGMADLRLIVLERDGYTCQICERQVTLHTAQVDHLKPFRRFKKPVDANTPENLWVLCEQCHRRKTESDREAESRVH